VTSDAPDPPPAISLVIPVFNEEDSLESLLAEVEPVLRECSGDSYEVLFVDDGSRDGSPEVLERLRRGNPRVVVWRLDRNHGLSSALHAGFHRARGEVIASMDADLQNDPADLPKLVAAIREGADMACGWRKERSDPLVKRLSSKIANAWRNWRTEDSVQDVTCPLKVLRSEVREVFHPFDGLHRFLPTLARMAGYRVVEIPVGHRPRLHGSSKYGVWNRVFRGLRDVRTVRWMKQRRLTYRAERVD
jgi:glycosyltransferase involved in cell wall biosynthesis